MPKLHGDLVESQVQATHNRKYKNFEFVSIQLIFSLRNSLEFFGHQRHIGEVELCHLGLYSAFGYCLSCQEHQSLSIGFNKEPIQRFSFIFFKKWGKTSKLFKHFKVEKFPRIRLATVQTVLVVNFWTIKFYIYLYVSITNGQWTVEN